jgi:hypothetical protein
MDLIAPLLALVSIGFGLFGWLAPRATMEIVDLQPGPSGMGPSEVRAASGALFIGLGLGVIVLASPVALAMLGFAWGGAAMGRLTSLVLDGSSSKKWTFFAVEAAVAATALAASLGPLS